MDENKFLCLVELTLATFMLEVEELSSQEDESLEGADGSPHQSLQAQSLQAKSRVKGTISSSLQRQSWPWRVPGIPSRTLNNTVSQLVIAVISKCMEKLSDPGTPTGVEKWLTGEFIEHWTAKDPILTKLGSLESSVNALSAFVGQVLEKQRELESLAAKKDIQALNDKVSKFESELKIIGKTLEFVLEKLIFVHAMSAIQSQMWPTTSITSSAPRCWSTTVSYCWAYCGCCIILCRLILDSKIKELGFHLRLILISGTDTLKNFFFF